MIRDFCTTCEAPLLWARTPTGRNIPLDPEPAAEGNIVLYDGDSPDAPKLAVVTHASQATGLPRYRAHFASCPHADAHRRARNKGARP